MIDSRTSHGVALPITMAFLVMITILVVGLAESMRLERPVAHSFLEKAKSEEFAVMGVEEVCAKLRYHTERVDRYWVSRPGELGLGNPLALDSTIPLHSGLPAASPSPELVLQPPSLNVRMMRPPYDQLITNRVESNGAPASMQLRWIYVRKDGTLETEPLVDTTDEARAFAGRYAYWTDDESSKINLNLAWGRGSTNTNPIGSPTRIDLTALPGMLNSSTPYLGANAVRSFITTSLDYATLNKGFFNTPEDARQVTEDGVADALIDNKFEVTHYNHDPDTTFFNEQRIVLTTSPALAGWTKVGNIWVGANGKSGDEGRPSYIRILTDAAESSGADPGRWSKNGVKTFIDEAKLTATLNRLMGATGFLVRNDWPMAPGGTFQAKYANNSSARLTQIALNIIDYVRSRESNLDMVEPLRGSWTGTQFTVGNASAASGFMGNTRSVLINEIGVHLAADNQTLTVSLELRLPEQYGLASANLSGMSLWMRVRREDGVEIAATNNDIALNGTEGATLSAPTISRGGYAVVSWSKVLPAPLVPRPAKLRIRAALSAEKTVVIGNPRVDLAPLDDGALAAIPVKLDAAAMPLAGITSTEANDPRVTKNQLSWKERSTGNSFGAKNSGIDAGSKPIYTAGTTPLDPSQDFEFTGSSTRIISEASLYMPPKGGRVSSAGELGFIHTGTDISGAGVPWRTFRLQPNGASNTSVPDWALMDLFTPPLSIHPNARSMFTPHGTTVGGRVNVNSKVTPFDMERIIPLAAVLANVPYETGNAALLPAGSIEDSDSPGSRTAIQLARNIYHALSTETGQSRLATEGKRYGHPELYDSPGEIIEIKGIADRGERGEELVRNISNLITARGNVFTIYTVGQSLKQTPAGKILVTAETRSQTMVERYNESAGGALRIVPVYSREVSR